jgi:hypothetical protein
MKFSTSVISAIGALAGASITASGTFPLTFSRLDNDDDWLSIPSFYLFSNCTLVPPYSFNTLTASSQRREIMC